jgi:hypothetical protein
LAVNRAAVQERKAAPIPPIAFVIGAIILAGIGGFVYLQMAAHRPPPPPQPLTGAAKEYTKFLKFVSADGQTQEGPQMQAHESYMKLWVLEITGNIRNTGDRVLDTIEINCVFTDPMGNVLYRQRVPIVSKKMGKLSPGETKPFRMAFDDVSEAWNQALPQMVIAAIEFD